MRSDKPLPDISQINEELFISAWPKARHGPGIRELGIRLILSMHIWRPSKRVALSPVRLQWLPTIDSPLFPMPISLLTKGVKAALRAFERGERVLTHCQYGIHRSVAMACCVLIARGLPAGEAMSLVKHQRPAADPDIWYIRSRIVKFERAWLRDQFA